MATWWFLIFSAPVLMKLSEKYGQEYRIDNVNYSRNNKIFFFCSCFLLIFFAGLRSTTGAGVLSIGDTRVYNSLFQIQVKNNIIEYLRFTDFSGDWGFYALLTIFKQFLGVNEQGLFFICSLITIGLLFLRYYSLDLKDMWLLIFLFIALGSYVSTMNGVRQWFASSILFFSFPLIRKKKWLIYFLIVIVMSTIHNSSIIFIFIYFIADKPAWGKTTKFMVGIILLLFITYPITGNVISEFLQESSYSQYSDTILISGEGSNIIRVAVYVLPIVVAYIYRDNMSKEKYYNIIINLSILDMLFMILALTNWIYARICIFLDPFILIVYIWDIKYAISTDSQKLIKIFGVILGLIYFWYQMYIGYGGQIYTSHILGI